jgi:hypothetical protein
MWGSLQPNLSSRYTYLLLFSYASPVSASMSCKISPIQRCDACLAFLLSLKSWCFGVVYSEPLPAAVRFHLEIGCMALSDNKRAAFGSTPFADRPSINPLVATYSKGPTQASSTGIESRTARRTNDYKREATVSLATKEWRAAGTVGVVTSSLSSASVQSQQENEWHAVAMARKGSKV